MKEFYFESVYCSTYEYIKRYLKSWLSLTERAMLAGALLDGFYSSTVQIAYKRK